MAKPAGYSSDEEYDSDDFDNFSFSNHIPHTRREASHKNFNENILSNEEKLIDAVRKRNLDEVKQLLENGADVNYRPRGNGWSPLMLAASLGESNLVDLLLKQGADPNINIQFNSPILCLSDSNCKIAEDQLLQCFDLLINAGATTDVLNSHGETPLMCASARGHIQLVTRLLEFDPKIDFKNSDGWTAVFFAVNGGQKAVVKLLKEKGCDLSVIDWRGQTLSELAYSKRFNDIAEVILHDSVDEIEDTTYVPNNMSNFQFVLSQLPDYKNSKFSGFNEDFILLLHNLDMKSLIPVMVENKIGYSQFLTNTYEDWQNLGLKFSFNRIKLVTFAYDIIQKGWSRQAFKDFECVDCTLYRVAQKLLNNIRVVNILAATNYVCKRDFHIQHVENEKIKEQLHQCLHEVKVFKTTIRRVRNLLEAIEERSVKYPADYIDSTSQFVVKKVQVINKIRFYSILILPVFIYFFRKSFYRLKNILASSNIRIMR